MNVFAQITKVDEAKRLVTGRAVQEVPDHADEIFDYASSKPYFMDWSKSFSDDTDGKSLGNVRAMHGKVAAGKLTGIEFNDADKAIDVQAKIVDDNEWKKVIEGVYTGFSIGGSYVGDKIAEKIDDREVKRYTAKPSEVSIVDAPCIPTAKFFEVVKADGAVQKVEFKPAAEIELVVTGTDEEVAEFAKVLNESGWTMRTAIDLIASTIALNKEEGDAFLMRKTATEIENFTEAERKDFESHFGKREFSAGERKQAAKEGQALPDGSFPIKTVADLENAVRAYGRAKDKAAAKAHIIKRAKALDATDKLPKGWTDSEKAAGGDLAKGMWNVREFAEALQCIANIAASAQYDLETEGDNSPVPAELRNWISDGVAIFKAMSAEEADELVAGLKTSAGVGDDDEIEVALELACKAGELRKRLADPALTLADAEKIGAEYGEAVGPEFAKRVLAKAGARHSKADMTRLQAAHDNLVAMGAECAGDKEAAAPVADLHKQLAAKDARIEELDARLKRIEDQPAPTKLQLRIATKAQDNTPDAPDLSQYLVYKADGSIDASASVIKAIHAGGGTPIDPRLRAAK